MYKHAKKILISIIIISLPIIALGFIKRNSTTEYNDVKKILKENFGIKENVKIINSPIDSILEIEHKGQIIYSTIDGRYIFIGNILDTKNKSNLTEKKIELLQKINWSDLPLNNAIVWQKGENKEKRKIAIFSDPNCGFCKKMEQELQKMNNITVYTFLTPILSDDSMQKAKDIWCSANNIQIWQDWMLNNNNPQQITTNCVNPIKSNIELSAKIGVTGTPAIIFMDNSRVNGLISAEELDKKLNSIH